MTSQLTLAANAFARLIFTLVVLALMFFLPAGTMQFWEAWVFITIVAFGSTLLTLDLLRRDPELLRKRLLGGEKEPEQKWVMGLAWIVGIAMLTLTGFDHREGWSHVPPSLKTIGFAAICSGYGIFFLVMRVNSYASRTIKVEEGQHVISQGPYSLVRHPLYFGALFLYGGTPFALDCYWALLPFTLLAALLVIRIRGEERLLRKELAGYDEYTRTVRYRLIPGVW